MKKKDNTIHEYLEFKRLSVNSKRKLKDIERYISRFLKVINVQNPTEKELIKFINSLNIYKTRTKNDLKVLIKNFVKWKYPDYSARFRNLDRICKTEKGSDVYRPEQHITKEDIEKLVIEEKEPKWKAYISILFYSGSRPQEICNLKWKDLTFDNDGCFIKIYSGKHKNYFDKFVPDNVVFYLNKIKNNNSDYVFPSPKNKNKPITESAVYYRISQLSKNVLNKKVNPYLIRHSIATILYNDDAIPDKRVVARQMGHSEKMRKVYDTPTRKVIEQKLKKIWIRTEELPQEKKDLILELQKKIEQNQTNTQTAIKVMEELRDNVLDVIGNLPEKELVKLMPKLKKQFEKLKNNAD